MADFAALGLGGGRPCACFFHIFLHIFSHFCHISAKAAGQRLAPRCWRLAGRWPLVAGLPGRGRFGKETWIFLTKCRILLPWAWAAGVPAPIFFTFFTFFHFFFHIFGTFRGWAAGAGRLAAGGWPQLAWATGCPPTPIFSHFFHILASVT